jgi:hypothetical protein
MAADLPSALNAAAVELARRSRRAPARAAATRTRLNGHGRHAAARPSRAATPR